MISCTKPEMTVVMYKHYTLHGWRRLNTVKMHKHTHTHTHTMKLQRHMTKNRAKMSSEVEPQQCYDVEFKLKKKPWSQSLRRE